MRKLSRLGMRCDLRGMQTQNHLIAGVILAFKHPGIFNKNGIAMWFAHNSFFFSMTALVKCLT
jgi:hypothetical protein